MNRTRNLLLGLALSAIFLWFALRGLDWQNVLQTLRTARWGFLLLAMLIWSLGLGTRALRWRALLGGQVRPAVSFHVLNIGFLLNNTLPFRAGELARAYLIGRDSPTISGWGALTTIVTERIVDMLTVLLLLISVLPTLVVDEAALGGSLIMGLVAVTSFAVLLLFAHRPALAHALLDAVLRMLPFLKRFNLRGLLDRILAGLKPITRWETLLRVAGWTAVSWLLSVVGSWVLAMAFPALPQTPVMRAALTLSIVAASFSIMIPFTLASVGPFEAAAIFALLTAGVPQEVAAAYAVVWHAGTVLVYALWGAVGILNVGLSLEQIRQGAASLRQSSAPGQRPD
ncbi:MAG: lysylphosphatidylglycerol synthase transmembrane domain-containing protein [Anaerolineae bacterium]